MCAGWALQSLHCACCALYKANPSRAKWPSLDQAPASVPPQVPTQAQAQGTDTKLIPAGSLGFLHASAVVKTCNASISSIFSWPATIITVVSAVWLGGPGSLQFPVWNRILLVRQPRARCTACPAQSTRYISTRDRYSRYCTSTALRSDLQRAAKGTRHRPTGYMAGTVQAAMQHIMHRTAMQLEIATTF